MMYFNKTKQEYMMKRVLFSFVFALLLSFGLSNAMTVQPFIDPAEFWTDPAMNDHILTNQPFAIEIQLDNPDVATGRATVQIPLAFYGYGDITTWSFVDMGGEIYPEVVMTNGFQYNPYPNPWFALLDTVIIYFDSANNPSRVDWDGTTPDSIVFAASGVAGMPNGTPLETRLEFWFNISDPDTSVPGGICVDSISIPGLTPPGKYDWLFDPPVPTFGGPYCYSVKTPPNFPPEFKAGECPTVDKTVQWDDQLQFMMLVEDAENDDLTDVSKAADVAPDGTYDFVITDATTDDDGETKFTFNPTCDDVGSFEFTVGVTDALHSFPTGKECVFTVTVQNTAPVISGNCDDILTVGVGSPKQAFFTATDANTGDTEDWDAFPEAGVQGAVSIVDGELTYTPHPDDEALSPVVITVRVTDCANDYDECDVVFNVISKVPFDIVIEKDEGEGPYAGKGVLLGHHGFLDVSKEAGTEEMWGYDFLIGYDNSVLTFIQAIDVAGPDHGWEYFTYRYDWNGNCGTGCPTGLLRVVGMADRNDGVPFTGDLIFEGVLFQLDFMITNNHLYQCMYIPVYFYWMDCGDNTIAYRDRAAGPYDIQTAVSKGVFWWDGHEEIPPFPYLEITDFDYGFPGMFGVYGDYGQGTGCFIGGGPEKPKPDTFIYFYDGGFDIICDSDIDLRGDLNLNGLANEIADAVVFTNYFIYSLVAFDDHIEGSIAASDVNGDGIVLTVADLVYLIRIIVGDVDPYPGKLAPNLEANVVADGHVVSIDAEVGAAHFIFAGDVEVSLAEGAAGMEIGSNFDGVNTNVLIYNIGEGVTASGNVLYANGDLISVEAADYQGSAYKSTILPAEFDVRNYPNPFNAVATIKMYLPQQVDWSLGIYNVAGQKVADFGGNDLGEVTVKWNAGDQASGIYFYKFEAEKFSATKKMVLLK
jgi:hypothetical protein